MKLRSVLEAGVDEAGRGPLAGPVAVAAVILPPDHGIRGLDDSKKLSPVRRQTLAPLIESRALAWHVEFVEVGEIDRVNILQATLNGMQRAVAWLDPQPDSVVVDGIHAPRMPCRVSAVKGGDRLVASISAASVLAKVHRDRLMRSLHEKYPEYGFDRHKGYPTPLHLERLRAHGPCPVHRQSFTPVKNAIRRR